MFRGVFYGCLLPAREKFIISILVINHVTIAFCGIDLLAVRLPGMLSAGRCFIILFLLLSFTMPFLFVSLVSIFFGIMRAFSGQRASTILFGVLRTRPSF